MKLASKATNQRTARQSRDYSIAADFGCVFHDQMDPFYTLAFLLTADHQTAEQVFLMALQDCLDGMPVFQDRVTSWSKRAVIKAAIRIVRALQKKPSAPEKPGMGLPQSMGLTVAGAITGLPELERFAYVLTVLERHSDRECSVLLDATVGEIVRARNKALQQLADKLTSSADGNSISLSRDEPDEFVMNCVNFHRSHTSNR